MNAEEHQKKKNCSHPVCLRLLGFSERAIPLVIPMSLPSPTFGELHLWMHPANTEWFAGSPEIRIQSSSRTARWLRIFLFGRVWWWDPSAWHILHVNSCGSIQALVSFANPLKVVLIRLVQPATCLELHRSCLLVVCKGQLANMHESHPCFGDRRMHARPDWSTD